MAFANAAVAGKAGERMRRGTSALVLLPLLMCCIIAEKLKLNCPSFQLYGACALASIGILYMLVLKEKKGGGGHQENPQQTCKDQLFPCVGAELEVAALQGTALSCCGCYANICLDFFCIQNLHW